MRHPGGHGLVNEDRSAGARLGACSNEQIGVGTNPDHDEDQVDIPTEGRAVVGLAKDVEPGVGPADAGDGRAGAHIHAVSDQFLADECAEFDVYGGKYFGEHLDLGDLDAAGGEAFGHFQADVAGAHDQGGLGLDPVDGLGEREGVAHGVE